MFVRSYGFRVAVLFASAAAVSSIPAAAKNQPAPDWAVDAAKTATPADVGDAPAVLLFDEYVITVDAQNHAVERERFATRILKPQGRGYAHCAVDYDVDEKLDYFHAWTITSQGQQFQAKDTDFMDKGAYDSPELQDTERIRELNPPAGDPGAVVACETEVHLRPYMDEEDWQFQLRIPVVNESLELDLPPGGHFAQSWSNYKPVPETEAGSNHLRWEIKNMPALDLENLHATPPWQALAARMSVKWGDVAVNGVDNQWRAIGVWQDQLEEHRTDPTPDITAKVQELTAGAPDLYTKLSRITSYIQKNVRYFVVEKGIGGWQAHYASDIYHHSYGDCKDKTTLLISMLQVIGVRAYYLHVDSHRGVINPEEPSLMGNHMITAIELPEGENDPRLLAKVKAANGKTLLIFDPTDEETPVGLIRSDLQGAYGNLAEGDASQVLLMPILTPDSGGRNRTGSFTLAGDGTFSGDVTEVLVGVDAAYERGLLKESTQKEVRDGLEMGVSADLPGVTFKGFEFQQTEKLDQPMRLDMHLSTASYAHSAGPLLLLRPRVMGRDSREVPDVMEAKARHFAIEIGHPGCWRDSFDITLPAGYTVDGTPDPVSVDVGFASYKSSVTAKGNVLHYEREYVVKDVEIPAGKAEDFRTLEASILEDEKGAVVLKKN